jgi:hypothetical protein
MDEDLFPETDVDIHDRHHDEWDYEEERERAVT